MKVTNCVINLHYNKCSFDLDKIVSLIITFKEGSNNEIIVLKEIKQYNIFRKSEV